MKLLNSKTLFILTVCMIVLTVVSTGIGIFYFDSGTSFEVPNQYGDIVRMSGQGIYAHDSYFKAHISKGTDFIFLFAVVPILIAALVYDSKMATQKLQLLLTSVIGCVLYYSASYVLGVSYNSLFLIYVSLFCVSFFWIHNWYCAVEPIRKFDCRCFYYTL